MVLFFNFVMQLSGSRPQGDLAQNLVTGQKDQILLPSQKGQNMITSQKGQ
jgi:hypothetical protein